MSGDINQRIFQFLYPDWCWHKFEQVAPDEWRCKHCFSLGFRPNPNYTDSPGDCLALLEAVRAKGYAVETWTGQWAGKFYSRVKIVKWTVVRLHGTWAKHAEAEAATLPEALAKAVLKLVEAEAGV